MQVAPAVLTELPDGSMVAAVPQSKSGLARGRSYWGSGTGFGFGRRSSSGGSSSWTEALANLRAHWPGEASAEESASTRAGNGAGPSGVP
jgi:hypothetical protein